MIPSAENEVGAITTGLNHCDGVEMNNPPEGAHRASSKPLPYYPLYVNDFDENEHVLAMNVAEVGVYVLALNESWKRGSIPDDPRALATLIRKDPKDVRKAWPSVRSRFVEGSIPGRLVNTRQEKERVKAVEKSIKATASARSKHSGRSANAHANAPADDATFDDANAHPRASESVSESASGSSFSESEVKEKNLVKSIDGDGFQEYIGVFLSLGVAISETDMRKCSMYWISLSFEEQLAALADVRKQHARQWSSCATRYVTRPWNHLEEKHWTRRAMVPAKDRGKTQAEAEQAKATSMFMRGKGL